MPLIFWAVILHIFDSVCLEIYIKNFTYWTYINSKRSWPFPLGPYVYVTCKPLVFLYIYQVYDPIHLCHTLVSILVACVLCFVMFFFAIVNLSWPDQMLVSALTLLYALFMLI